MSPISYILATAGHVDHGKSALVRALTGIDPDRLPEEKARGITIQLGFAHLTLPSPPDVRPPVSYRVGIVDVPGHEDFVKNMVAGVGSIDAALLVVAADDGWMPQTEEHLQILTYAGVRRGLVALTKVDLITSEAEAIAAVREKLIGSPLAEARIVPTSVVTERGLDELKSAISQILAHAPPQADVGKPRLPVDRVFALKGIGTIVTGTLTGGRLRRQQAVIVQPTGRPTRVRSVQTYSRDVDTAPPGSRVALNLPDLYPSTGRSSREADWVARGDVITISGVGRPSDTLDVLLERSVRLPADTRPLKSASLIQVHHGSAATPARVYLYKDPALAARDRGLAQLRLERPIFILAGDRLILRDWPEQHTLAGGIVLNPIATRGGITDSARRVMLEARAAAPDDVAVFVASQLATDGIAVPGTLLVQSKFAPAAIDQAIRRLAAEGRAVVLPTLVADPGLWNKLRDRVTTHVDQEHQQRPERAGIELSLLKATLGPEIPPDAFESLIANLSADGFVRSGNLLRRSTHRPMLPARLAEAGARVRSLLADHPFDPPSRKELAPDPTAQQALRFLLINGEAIEISSEVVIAREAMGRAVESIRDHLRRHGGATVSELKSLLGSSRRIMVPLLEKLDKDGVTRREGDRRLLPSSRGEA
jgi:selenocysteine-specific elongation factor